MQSLTLTPGRRSAANAVGHVIFYYLVTAATKTFYRLREGFILIVFTNGIFIPLMFDVYIVFVFFRKGTLNLKPRSVVCPAPSSFVFVSCSNKFFFPSLF